MSILDEKLPELDPTVWYQHGGQYRLRPEVEGKIKKLARKLLVGTKVKRAYIVGSLTGYYYRPTSDLDVTLVVKADDELLLALKENTKTVNGELAPGTQHPINFFVLNDLPNLKRFDGVYDLKRHKWKKQPTETGVDIFSVYDRFRDKIQEIDTTAAEAWRSLVDIDIFREALARGGERQIAGKLRRRIEDLDDAVDELASKYNEAHQDRINAFRRQLELAELGQAPYPTPNLVPENIWYKLLERYHYLEFLTALYKLVESTGNIDTAQDIRDVRRILLPRMQDREKEATLDGLLEKWRH
jgi:predicted nucleotidyltransferase